MNDVPSGRQTVRAETGSFVQELGVTVARGQNSAIAESQLCVEQKSVRIAVVTGQGDKIEDLLTSLNLTFTTFDGSSTGWPTVGAEFMSDLNAMKQFDIIFVNCAAAKSGSAIDFGPNANAISRNLQAYVAEGGNLYASDWAALFVAAARPRGFGFLTSTGMPVGNPLSTNVLMGYAPQTVSAKIADSNLAAFLGKTTVPIDFPKMTGAISLHWGLMSDVEAGADVLVSTMRADTCKTTSCTATGMAAYNIPLAASVKVPGGGRVVYTSFHNIGQNGDDVAQILKYLILKL